MNEVQALAYQAIGRRLRDERRRAGRTQADLARAIGVRQATITRYERGGRRIPIPALQRLAMVLRLPLDRILASNEAVSADNVRDQIAAIHTTILQAARALDALQARLDLPEGEAFQHQSQHDILNPERRERRREDTG